MDYAYHVDRLSCSTAQGFVTDGEDRAPDGEIPMHMHTFSAINVLHAFRHV